MKTLNLHFAEIAKAAFQRHGFASADLAAQWPVIVGDEIAAVTRPDKIKWPQRNAEAKKLGGTLLIRAQAGRALDIHYKIPRIMERVNQYLGYSAITAIKVLQTQDEPVPPKPVAKPMRAEAKAAWDEKFATVENDDLKAALSRMAGHISPQGPLSTGQTETYLSPPTSSRKYP